MDPNASTSALSSGLFFLSDLCVCPADTSPGQSPESAMVISSLREVIRTQAGEIDALKAKVKDLSSTSSQVRPLSFFSARLTPRQVQDLHVRIAAMEAALEESEGKKRDVEKEQEDLLVLLDEMSTKRRRDKARMREVGLEVSEDEGDEESDEEDEDEE